VEYEEGLPEDADTIGSEEILISLEPFLPRQERRTDK